MMLNYFLDIWSSGVYIIQVFETATGRSALCFFHLLDHEVANYMSVVNRRAVAIIIILAIFVVKMNTSDFL